MKLLKRTILNPDWWAAAGLRALRTFGQVAATSTPITFGLLSEINWVLILSSSAAAAIFSLFMSLGGLPEVDPNNLPE